MLNSDKTVLITGATGRQGGAVIRHMLPKGWKLRALTRNPGGHAAQALTRLGIELAPGDLEDPASLDRAVRGVYGVYSVQDFWAVGAKREVRQGPMILAPLLPWHLSVPGNSLEWSWRLPEAS
jgi:uncharacterized protein YbjT (DUF2867 family)